jgi:hypothetical protein
LEGFVSYFKKEKEMPYLGSVATDHEKTLLRQALSQNGITTAEQAKDMKLVKKACRQLPFIRKIGSVPGKDKRGLVQIQFSGNRIGQGDFGFVFAS